MAQAQSHPTSRSEALRLTDNIEEMVSLLTRIGPQTDSEAFAVLRRSFPLSPLCERVAVVSRWRAG